MERYSLGEQIGEGGFGAVYSAFDNELRRTVAIKLLDPAREVRSRSEAERLRERFRREAVATASVDHPNVVTIYDVGIDEEKVFIVMELLDGLTLADELPSWPTGIRPERALPLFIAALRGLHAGHIVGVVHKDLKPANLFLANPRTDKERLCIIDFGVARVAHEEKLTATGKIVGSPRYLAPEYIEHLSVTPRVDVYQMGLILVETLAGLPCIPRRLELVTCCQRHRDGDLKIPTGLRSGPIGEVILRATASNPDDRFQTADAFADALAAVDPSAVRADAPGKAIATPRLGVAPLQKKTLQMHGGAGRQDEAPAPPKPREHRATGPTKQIGSARDVAAKLAELDAVAEPAAEVEANPEVKPPAVRLPPMEPATSTQIVPEKRHTAYTVVYLLVAVAAISALSTLGFLFFAKPRAAESPAVPLGATVLHVDVPEVDDAPAKKDTTDLPAVVDAGP